MKAKLKRSILLVLLACDGMPMPEAALLSAVALNARPDEPTDDDIGNALKDCQAEGFVLGATDDFSKERTWSLAEPKGVHKARQLRR